MRHFFEQLPATSAFNDFANSEAYLQVPEDWYVALTDVKGSTKAIQEGRYKDVNAIGVASIAAIFNAVEDVNIPFVFGGDGATLLVPSEDYEAVKKSLSGLKALSKSAFSLELRCGLVPVRDLMAAGHKLYVARYATSDKIPQAFMSGEALKVAERWVKDEELGVEYEVQTTGNKNDADCRGFECRWETIPSTRGIVLSIIVEARGLTMTDRNEIYMSLLDEMARKTKAFTQSCPVNQKSLKLNKRLSGFFHEERIRTNMASALNRRFYAYRAWTVNYIGRRLLKRGKNKYGFGDRYIQELIANTDYLKFDEALRMVIDVPGAEMEKILSILEQFRRKKDIFYGTHTSSGALMTCIVMDREGEHIHFIDGADGGYCLAASQLKSQRAMVDKV